MIRQQWKQQLGDVGGGSWMCLHPNDAKMFRQRQNHPITKMVIYRDERSSFVNRPLQNLGIISPCLANILRPNNIMPCVAQL